MTNESRGAPAVQITLGDALNEYISSLKPEQRHAYEAFVRKYVEYAGAQMAVGDLTGSRVESYAEVSIKHTDPNADKRVAALKKVGKLSGWLNAHIVMCLAGPTCILYHARFNVLAGRPNKCRDIVSTP